MGRTLSLILLALFLAGCAPAVTPTAAPTEPPAREAPTTVPTDTTVPPTTTSEPKTLNVFAAASLTDAFTEIGQDFEAAHPGVTVDLQLVAQAAVTTRLQAAFWADLDVPDLVEVEISSAGSFFRGPMKDVGFVDLTDRIHRSGLWDGMVHARFAPYTRRGHIFGLPHDVHPVQLAYRRDIFEREGVDVGKIRTWDDFIRVGRKLTVPNQRYMMELSDSDSSNLEMCLFQRGGGYFNPRGDCTLDDEIAVRTMRWYVPLVAGPHRIGNNLGSGQILTQAVERAGTLEPEKINEVLHREEFTTVGGKYRYDERGVNTYPKPFLTQVQDGKLVIVWPQELTPHKLRFPVFGR